MLPTLQIQSKAIHPQHTVIPLTEGGLEVICSGVRGKFSGGGMISQAGSNDESNSVRTHSPPHPAREIQSLTSE